MNLAKLIEFLRNRLKTVVRVCVAALVLLVLCDAVLVDKSGAHTGVERLPAFWAVFGFVGCALIVIVSKCYGHAGIMTREDYYEGPSKEEEPGHRE
jgi:hypothetical protein